MALENIAVDGCILEHSAGSPISGGSFNISSTSSAILKADGKGVHKGPLVFTFSGGSAAGFVAESVQTTAPASMLATATKTKTESVGVMREGDSVLMNCIGTYPPPTGGTGPVSGNVEIDDAGQTRSKAQ